MKYLKAMIVFMSCLSLFCTVAIADEDVVVDGDSDVLEDVSDEDSDEIVSVLDALEDLYGDQDVSIVAGKSKDNLPVDTENNLGDGEGSGGEDEVGDVRGDDEENYSNDDLSGSDEETIQISIYKNEKEETQEIDTGTDVDLEQTSAHKRRNKRPFKRLMRVVAPWETFIRPHGECPTFHGAAYYTLIDGKDARNRKVGHKACLKARNKAYRKIARAIRNGLRCFPSRMLPQCEQREVRIYR